MELNMTEITPTPVNEAPEGEFHIEAHGDGEIHVPIIYREDGTVDEEAMVGAIEQARQQADNIIVIINRQLNANTEITDGNQS